MRWLGLFFVVLALFFTPAASQAVSLSWSGSMELGATSQLLQEPMADLFPETILAGQVELCLEIMGEASWSGMVALLGRLECPGREEDSYPSSNPSFIKLAFADCRLDNNSLLRLGRQRIAWGIGFQQKLGRFFGDLRQNYLYGMIRGDIGGNLSLSTDVLWNLDDRSSQLIPMIEYKLGQDVLVTLAAFIFEGDMNSEFGSLPWKRQVSLRLFLAF
ncbi:MAG: hypothetical protein K6U74_10990 [Firmicutes bacterium]|nr:hypothetical protein [Bacillota bacterium]